MIRRFSTIAMLVTALLAGSIFGLAAAPFDVPLEARQIVNFRIGDANNNFGKLQFIGGLEFTSTNAHVGAFSGLVVLDNRQKIVAVTDTGFWFSAQITRDADGRPLSLQQGKMSAILDSAGKPFQYKWNVDAESLAINKDSVFVAFERDNRVLRYKLDLENFATTAVPVPLNLDASKLRYNKGLETVAIAPQDSPLAGATIIISERSFDSPNQIIGAILDGPQKGRFTIQRIGRFDITDGDFLPNGDLLILERRFNLASGVGLRIRRIKAADIRSGASLTGEILLEADTSYQIDNMEGLFVTRNETGSVSISLISDNNHSWLQRNLYLEFKLLP